MSKSLKKYITTAAIIHEVEGWKISELDEYLKNHESGNFFSNLLSKNKLRIVAETLAIKVIDQGNLTQNVLNNWLHLDKFRDLKNKIFTAQNIQKLMGRCALNSENCDSIISKYKNDPILKNLIQKLEIYKEIKEVIEKNSVDFSNCQKYKKYKNDPVLKNLIVKFDEYCITVQKMENCTLDVGACNKFIGTYGQDSILYNLTTEVSGYRSIKQHIKTNMSCEQYKKLIEKYSGHPLLKGILNKSRTSVCEYKNLGIDNSEDLSEISKSAPKEAQDPSNIGSRVTKNTGVYLWAKGYDVVEFLGAGSFGVVWKCKKKNSNDFSAIKVMLKNNKLIDREVENIEELQELLKNDKTGKAEKYLNLLKVKTNDDTVAILKAPLADKDLSDASCKSIDSILRKAVQALKSVKVLHDNGYSHNDIKPSNFLKVSNWKSKKQKVDQINGLEKIKNILKNKWLNEIKKLEKIKDFTKKHTTPTEITDVVNDQNIDPGKKLKNIGKLVGTEKIHKHRVQLSDFGTLTRIDSGVYCGIYTPKFIPQCEEIYLGKDGCDIQMIAKRDVYALGVTFLFLLLGNISEAINICSSNYDFNPHNDFFNSFLHIRYTETSLKDKENILSLIAKMVKKDYKQRINLDDALLEAQRIKSSCERQKYYKYSNLQNISSTSGDNTIKTKCLSTLLN